MATKLEPAPAPTASELNIQIRGAMGTRYDEILTSKALQFVARIEREFGAQRRELLQRREKRQAEFDAGVLPDFLEDTKTIREDDWRVGPIPQDLQDRRVEITGPTDRKMVINALNCGATHFMADFEDATSPTWDNLISGQINLMDAARGTISHTDPASGKQYALNAETATLMVRARGLHLEEAHVCLDGVPISGSFFDFGLFLFHNAQTLLDRGTGPYFYLPKLESYLEARLWNKVFVLAQELLGLPQGTIKATVLLETLPAAFEMEEILFELKDHMAGLNCGRWDYIFSFIKCFRNRPEFVLPDRSQVVMGSDFLRSYSLRLIQTCHRRGAHAMGGMAAQIPVKNDEAANEAAFAKVRADKEREATDGHDGTWVAHPALVSVARDVFDRLMPTSNQVDRLREDIEIGQADLLQVHEGKRTEEGMRDAIRIGVQYIEAWLRGRGAVPLYNLMEDAATAEISRAQIWQWLRHGATLSNGKRVTEQLFHELLAEEMNLLRSAIGTETFEGGRFDEAIEIFAEMSTSERFENFLTLPAYQHIITLVEQEPNTREE